MSQGEDIVAAAMRAAGYADAIMRTARVWDWKPESIPLIEQLKDNGLWGGEGDQRSWVARSEAGDHYTIRPAGSVVNTLPVDHPLKYTGDPEHWEVEHHTPEYGHDPQGYFGDFYGPTALNRHAKPVDGVHPHGFSSVQEAMDWVKSRHPEESFDPDDKQDPFDPRLIGASRRTAALDQPHHDWQPLYKGRPVPGEKWHPPYGESHVKYHVWRGGGGNNPIVWTATHHGLATGPTTFKSPLGLDDRDHTRTVYEHEDDPERIGRFRTPQDARAAAEHHYLENYPQPRHKYDLSHLDAPTPPPAGRGLGDDEDYSRIFDAVRRALRQATAALRRVAFTGDGDWKIDQWGNHECRLENGHVLYCTQVKSRPEVGWQWGIYDRNQEDPEKRAYAVRQGGQHWGGFTADDPQDHLPTAEHARRQAEQEYQKMFPLGTSTGGHKSQIGDSGVDYEKLINSRADLGDEDYGHIFGMRRTAAGTEIDLGEDRPQDGWEQHGENSHRWQPYVGGDTHAQYRILSYGGGPFSTIPHPLWNLKHLGVYQGKERQIAEDGTDWKYPEYSLRTSPENVGDYSSLEEAKEAARQHMEQTYGKGSDPIQHAEQKRPGDDEDFSYIFGMLRRMASLDEDIYDENGDYIGPDWPQDLAHHLHTDPHRAAYDAGYHAAWHPAFRDYNDRLSTAENAFWAAGGKLTSPVENASFEDGWLDSVSEIPHKFLDPDRHEQHHAEETASIAEYKDKQHEDAIRKHFNPYPDWNPDDKQDPFDPRLIGAGLRRTAAHEHVESGQRGRPDWTGCAHPECRPDLPTTMYHVSHPRNRDSIAQHGLLASYSEDDDFSDGLGMPHGIYLTADEPKPSHDTEQWPGDVWAVDTTKLKHLENDFPGGLMFRNAYATKYDVPPEAMRLHRPSAHHRLGGLHARLAAKASPVDPGVVGRIAAELSPPCPDCGQVAGFDEHMVSPRVRVCRNCEYPMTDVGHDEFLNDFLAEHDKVIGDLPETDHPTLGKHGQLSYEDTMKLIDEQLAKGDQPPSQDDELTKGVPAWYMGHDDDDGPYDDPSRECDACGTVDDKDNMYVTDSEKDGSLQWHCDPCAERIYQRKLAEGH